MADITGTLIERGKRYGKFKHHATVTIQLKQVISKAMNETSYKYLDADQQEALDMICHKIGRIVCGDPNYVDSWVDIAGYAKLVADRLEEEQTHDVARSQDDAVLVSDGLPESLSPHQISVLVGT